MKQDYQCVCDDRNDVLLADVFFVLQCLTLLVGSSDL